MASKMAEVNGCLCNYQASFVHPAVPPLHLLQLLSGPATSGRNQPTSQAPTTTCRQPGPCSCTPAVRLFPRSYGPRGPAVPGPANPARHRPRVRGNDASHVTASHNDRLTGSIVPSRPPPRATE